MTKKNLTPGSLVSLKQYVCILEQTDADGNDFCEAILEDRPNVIKNMQKIGPPLIFETDKGTYLGSFRVRVYDRRAGRRIIRRLLQKFYFVGREVCIDPKAVDVLISAEEIIFDNND